MSVQFGGRVFWSRTKNFEEERIDWGWEGRSNMRMRQRTVNRLAYTMMNVNKTGNWVYFVHFGGGEEGNREIGKC